MQLGADPEQLDRLADALDRFGRRALASYEELGRSTASLRWSGNDRILFDAALREVRTHAALLTSQLTRHAGLLREEATAQRHTSAAPGSTTVILHDPRHNREIAAIGNVEHASHVVVLVGGIGTKSATFPQQTRRAQRLFEQMVRTTGLDPNDIAIYAWLDYDAPRGFDEPQHLTEAMSPTAAIEGGARLHRFLDQLPIEVSTTVTLIGHSYGSLVVTTAATTSKVVDRVAVVGSPGLMANRVNDLDLSPGVRLFAASAQNDEVSHLQFYGPDPASMRFGAELFGAEQNPADSTGSTSPHSSYFDSGSESLANLALIAAGLEPSVAHPNTVEEAGGSIQRALTKVRFGNDLGRALTLNPHSVPETIVTAAAEAATTVAGAVIDGVDARFSRAAGDLEAYADLMLDR